MRRPPTSPLAPPATPLRSSSPPGADDIGGTASPATTTAVLLDATKPTDAFSLTSVTGGVFKSGTTLYYKGNAAGSFKLRDTVTDAASAPASATFAALTGGSGLFCHTRQTISTPPRRPPYPLPTSSPP